MTTSAIPHTTVPPAHPRRARLEERATHAQTLSQLLLTAEAKHEGAALRHKENGAWVDMSYGELGQSVRAVARGLIALGIEPGERVAVLSETRPEWTIADLGALCAGAVVAPIYQTNSPDECAYVLEHADARLVFCENEEQLAKIERIRQRCPRLEYVVVLTGDGGEEAMSRAELLERGTTVPPEAVDARAAAISPDDLATLVYTSGTTGPPKGCMLTHRNFLATVDMYEHQLDFDDGDERIVIFIFLPLAHSLARVTQFVTLDVGGTLAYWERDPEKLLDNLADTRPSHFPSVPRVFEKIHTKASAGIDEHRWARRALVRWAFATGRKVREAERAGRDVGGVLAAQRRLADKLVLSKVRALFGGEVELALTGAAPIAREVLEFFDSAGIPVLEGYGMTESTAAGTLNTLADLRFGTVGKPLPGTEVRIADDGEILMRGPHVFTGYFKNEGATRETLADGWLATGDLGSIDADGYVSVTGRKKDIIITSSGKNITPANIETALKESRWISEAVAYGDRRPYVVALVTLDADELPALAERAGVAPDLAAMAADARVHDILQADVDAVNEHLARIEQVKRFAILDHELSQTEGEMTPTIKVKRKVVYDKYSDVFASLYG